ncbi:hypothetical protein M3Y97_00687200 [Aphelenchoides bicaudatus]|nr:hypothetical protein M3Y97_00687200 [Aphelenchoides bicaudatus]
MCSLLPVTVTPPEISILSASKPEQECDHCQRCLYMTFVWYQRAESRRMLKHKMKHICKRYFEYRRHCLMTLLPKIEQV